MQEPADIWRPALIAGAVFGFVSGLPLVGLLNVACCSLVIGSGALAALLLVRASSQPVTYGRAAVTGMLSGLVAAPVQSATSQFLSGVIMGKGPAQQMEEALDRVAPLFPDADQARGLIESVPAVIWIALSTVVLMVVFAPFGALGGVIGRALFERRAGVPPPSSPTVPS